MDAACCPDHGKRVQALVTPEELAGAPASFGTVPVRGGGPGLKGYEYRVQVRVCWLWRCRAGPRGGADGGKWLLHPAGGI